MALSGDSAPQFTTLAKFVRELRSEITELFTQVLLSCDAQGLIECQMFAIDGVKLPSNLNVARERRGSARAAHAALRKRPCRLRGWASFSHRTRLPYTISFRETSRKA